MNVDPNQKIQNSNTVVPNNGNKLLKNPTKEAIIQLMTNNVFQILDLEQKVLRDEAFLTQTEDRHRLLQERKIDPEATQKELKNLEEQTVKEVASSRLNSEEKLKKFKQQLTRLQENHENEIQKLKDLEKAIKEKEAAIRTTEQSEAIVLEENEKIREEIRKLESPEWSELALWMLKIENQNIALKTTLFATSVLTLVLLPEESVSSNRLRSLLFSTSLLYSQKSSKELIDTSFKSLILNPSTTTTLYTAGNYMLSTAKWFKQ